MLALASGQTLSLLPQNHTKTLHFIRHGEAMSNVHGEKDRSQYKSPEWFDADLSYKGWAQAEALGKHIAANGIKPELVVVSTMTRALQTASAAFCSQPLAVNGTDPVVLMAMQAEKTGYKVARQELLANGAPPFLACELCREYIGLNPCDRRHSTSHQKKAFPGVNWSEITLEEDTLFPKDSHESMEQFHVRVTEFMEWVMKRPERELAVVTHSKFLSILFKQCAEQAGTNVSEATKADMSRWFENCELRTVVVGMPAAQSPCNAATTHFPGGHNAV